MWNPFKSKQKQPVARVAATEAAITLIKDLKAKHGDLMFHQSGGCCDGSAPMCYPEGDFKIGEGDVKLGEIEGTPFYISRSQFEVWAHTHLTLDVIEGRGASFSLEAPDGIRFYIKSRTFTDEETKALAKEEA